MRREENGEPFSGQVHCFETYKLGSQSVTGLEGEWEVPLEEVNEYEWEN